MATQPQPLNQDSQTGTNPFVKAFKWWLTPRSTSRDETFRERSIRVILGALIFLVLLSFASSLFVFRNEWAWISFPTMHVAVLTAFFVSATMLVRGQLTGAGWGLILGTGFGTAGIVLLAGQQGDLIGVFMGLPGFMFAVLLAALVLPRNTIFLIGLGSVVAYGLLLAVMQAEYPAVATLNATQIAISALLLVVSESVVLRQLRVEFDGRLNAMAESIRQTELAKQQAENARKQAEEQRQRAENADKAKSQFLANMSHELRTPLNAIIGYDEAMIGGMVGTFTQEQMRLLVNIQQNSRRLLALINDILDLSKIEAGAIEVYLSPISPRKVISSTVETVRGLAQDKNITLETHFDDSVPEVILGDTKKLEQILVNLLSNAIKFTSEGGVKVEVSAVDRTTWSFSVIDSGVGMPEDATQYIFEPFRQVDGTDTRKYKGTGLGLSITKELVKTLGGSIEVKSELGKGSTFIVKLPRASIPEAEVPQAAASPSLV